RAGCGKRALAGAGEFLVTGEVRPDPAGEPGARTLPQAASTITPRATAHTGAQLPLRRLLLVPFLRGHNDPYDPCMAASQRLPERARRPRRRAAALCLPERAPTSPPRGRSPWPALAGHDHWTAPSASRFPRGRGM